MLHTVNRSPFERNSLETCLRLAVPGSDILLIEDGVYAALKGTAVEARVQQAVKDHSLFVLGPDLKARGMADGDLIEEITVIGYDGFVELAVKNERVQAWL